MGAAALNQPGDLMPVDAAGVDLGQGRGDSETPELGHAPGVYGQAVMVDDLMAG
jgi:hypothetical protein